MWYHTWPWQEVYEYLAREVVLQCVGKAGLKADLLDKRQDSVRANYDVGPPQPGVTKLKQAILMALEKEHAVLLILDGLPASGARQVAAHVGEVARQAQRLPCAAHAVLQCIVSCDEPLQGPNKKKRTTVKLGKLSPAEQKAVCSKWFARFGKENVSDEQIQCVLKSGGMARPEAHLPLYLVLFASEASQLGIFENINAAMQAFPDDTAELWVRKTLNRLEEATHPRLVRLYMHHLLAAENGLNLKQLKDTASGDKALGKAVGASQAQLAQVTPFVTPLLPCPAFTIPSSSFLCSLPCCPCAVFALARLSACFCMHSGHTGRQHHELLDMMHLSMTDDGPLSMARQ